MRPLPLLLLCLACVSLAPLRAAAAPVVRTLDNGITLVVDEMHSAPVAAVRFYVRAGGVYEQEFTGAGISHYLEHLIGKGSTTRTPEDIDTRQEEMGNQANAYTSAGHTCYHMTSAARFADDMIELVADYVFNPLFDEKEVEKQRGIILREMAMGDDNPARRLYQLLSQTMFRVHPDRYRVIGYPDRFNRVTRDDLVRFHNRMYTTDNIVAVVVGDIDTQHTLATLENALGDVPRKAVGFPPLPVEPVQTSERRATEISPTLARAYLAVGFRTVDLFHPDLYPLDVLAYILANGASSRLVAQLRDDRGLVDSIGAYSATPVYDAGRFVITATLDESKLASAEQAIIAQLEHTKSELVTDAELSRAKKQKSAELVYARGSVESWASTLGSDYMSTGDVNFSRRYVEGIQQATAQDIREAARRYFRRDNMTVVTRRAGKALTEDTEATGPPTRPTTHKQSLPNGITLLIQPDHIAPMVNVQASFLGGVRYETPNTAGIGNVLAAMLKRGTATRTRMDIAETLDAVGAQMGVSSGRNSFNISGAALSEDAERLLSLMADCIRNPIFPQAELDRVKALSLSAIRAQQDSPDQVAMELLRKTLFKQHPYRLNPLGAEQSVAALTRESLIAHHKRICQPQEMVLAIYGDIGLDEARRLAMTFFGEWPSGSAQRLQLAPEPPPDHPLRALKERQQEQGLFFMGFPGPSVDSADRFALDVLDAAFSGIHLPGGRLHRKLRGEQLVYATHLVPIPGLDPGYVLLYAATTPEKLDTVEDIIGQLITAVQQEPLPTDELNRAKKMCISAHQVQLGGAADRMLQQTLDELYGLGFEASGEYASEIDSVTAEDVTAAARRYLDLQHCAVAITRPAPR